MALGILNYNILSLQYLGLYPSEFKNKKLYKFFNKFMFIQFLSTSVFQVIYWVKVENIPFSQKIVISANVVASLQVILRHFYFTYKAKQIKLLVTELEDSSECLELKTEETKMFFESTKMIRRFSQYIIGFSTIYIWALITRPIIQRFADPTNPILIYNNVWFPLDKMATPTYYFIFVSQVTTVFYVQRTVATTDAFACSLILAVAQRCELLARAAPQALLPAANDTATTPYCKAWINYHQHYIGLVSRINAVMGPVLLVTYFIAGLQITIFAFLLVQADKVGTAAVFTSVVMVLVRLFALAYAGQRVKNKSLQLGRSVLGARQVARAGLKAGPMRTTLQVIVTRCCKVKPDEINAMGFCVVDMDMFAAVLSACVSYILCLLQLKTQSS